MKKLDSKKSLLDHKKIIRSKPFLKKIYQDIYTAFKSCAFKKGSLVEIGSGGGFIKECLPKVITSDVIKGPDIDKVFAVEHMPFRSRSVAGFLMVNVFHHFKSPEIALREMCRCLKPGGRIVMVEPYNSLWGRFIYQHFHHEEFNPQASWSIKGTGRMSDANGAMPWIVFERDYTVFKKKFPFLRMLQLQPHTPFAYLLSGGLSRPQLVPTFAYPCVKFVERLLAPFAHYLGMFVTIELQKKATAVG